MTRLVLCAGKLWYDLAAKRRERMASTTSPWFAIEQLYPYPRPEIQGDPRSLSRRPATSSGPQEEPRNQGTWFFMLSRRHLAGMIPVEPPSRLRRARVLGVAAAGYLGLHLEQQRALVDSALGLDELAALKQRTA